MQLNHPHYAALHKTMTVRKISDKLSRVGWWSFQCIFPYCCLNEKLARLPGTTS